jgi:hypothetical protein
VDLETLGGGDSANIIQLGAVLFDPETGAVLSEFNQFVKDDRREIDLSTVLWWMQQPLAAQLASRVQAEGVSIRQALNNFINGVHSPRLGCVWALPAAYDLPILKHAFKQCGLQTPWHYRQERCARTVIAESGITRTPAGSNTHDAVFDCKVQIADLIRARAALKGSK